jgi:hypothetical protein
VCDWNYLQRVGSLRTDMTRPGMVFGGTRAAAPLASLNPVPAPSMSVTVATMMESTNE